MEVPGAAPGKQEERGRAEGVEGSAVDSLHPGPEANSPEFAAVKCL